MKAKGYGGDRRIPLEGTTCGYWKVGEYIPGHPGRYHCVCVCGTNRLLISKDLLKQISRSCGCKTAEIVKEQKKKQAAKAKFKAPEKFE